jgi:Domain of unknown function (DUF4402)
MQYRTMVAAALMAGAATLAMPAQAANGSAAGKAKILQPVTVTATGDLNFGTFVTDGSGGIIDLDTSGNLAACMGFSVCSGTTSAGTFRATGTVGQTLHISSPGNFFLTGSNGGTVEIGNVQFNGVGVAVQSYFHSNAMVPANGIVDFRITGSLWANPGTLDGDYAGTFSVNVDYQ